MRSLFYLLMISLIFALPGGCGNGKKKAETHVDKEQPELVRKYNDDGILLSISQVDEKGYVHGIKVNYYEDGKTIHSKVTYMHGRKEGPAIWYYKSGQIYEHTNFHYGRRQGVTRRYYEDGTLMEEVTYKQGEELPGKKVYNRDGELISVHP
jgi:antitoxin component YwqK of YwqJK toxin-antitoxin module